MNKKILFLSVALIIGVSFFVRAKFAVADTAASITVLSPNGGESWQSGQNYPVRWNSTGIPQNARISLNLINRTAKNNIGSWITVVDQNPNNAVNYYTVPANAEPGSSYEMLISVCTLINGQDVCADARNPYASVSDRSDAYFTVTASPDQTYLTTLSPAAGEVGDSITIYGKNLGTACEGKGSLECQASIWFGGYELHRQDFTFQDVVWNNEQIKLKIPKSAESGKIRIYRNEIFNYGTPEAYNKTLDLTGLVFTLTRRIPAKITKISINSGSVGDLLTIYGENLRNGCYGEAGLTCGASIFFGEYQLTQYEFAEAGPISWTDEKIALKIPKGAKTGKIRLYYNKIFNWGELNKHTEFYDIYGPNFTVTNESSEITKVIPAARKIGDTITIYGKNLLVKDAGDHSQTGDEYIYFGDKKFNRTFEPRIDVMSWQDDKIVVRVPEGAETGRIRVVQTKIVNFNLPGAYEKTIDVYGPVFKVIKNGDSNIEEDSQVIEIDYNANLLGNDKMSQILAELKELRNIVKEQAAKIKYLEKLSKDVEKLSAKMESAINNFITYGVDANTQKLGEGERAAVMYSYKAAFDKLPETEAELADAIKIANGRWPSITNQTAENEAKAQFQKIYKRAADMNNANDNAAVTVMAYGLRQKAENRNLNSEKAGIKIFKVIYGRTPNSTEDWNIMQAITYSGAKR